jgi:hypothetical protein
MTPNIATIGYQISLKSQVFSVISSINPRPVSHGSRATSDKSSLSYHGIYVILCLPRLPHEMVKRYLTGAASSPVVILSAAK